jgi:hypothetical protein
MMMHEPILQIIRTHQAYMKWMRTYIMTSCWDPVARIFQLIIGERIVCKKAFGIFWHLTSYSNSLLLKAIEEGVDIQVHGNFGQDRDSVKESLCGVFLSKLELVSKHQPDSEDMHLVERLQKIDCYEAMIEGTTPPKIL